MQPKTGQLRQACPANSEAFICGFACTARASLRPEVPCMDSGVSATGRPLKSPAPQLARHIRNATYHPSNLAASRFFVPFQPSLDFGSRVASDNPFAASVRKNPQDASSRPFSSYTCGALLGNRVTLVIGESKANTLARAFLLLKAQTAPRADLNHT